MTGGHLRDFQESFQETFMSERSKRPRRSFSAEFKQDAVDLVIKQGYSFKAAADAVGVAGKSLRDWHEKLAPEPGPCDEDAPTAMLQEEIKRLRKRLQRAEMEREILKKATAYFARESQ
jgi:transposase